MSLLTKEFKGMVSSGRCGGSAIATSSGIVSGKLVPEGETINMGLQSLKSEFKTQQASRRQRGACVELDTRIIVDIPLSLKILKAFLISVTVFVEQLSRMETF